jgi:serine/threonine-protein kinase
MNTRMQQIGRYRIVEELGRGAMGIVYGATDPEIGRTVAIKTIRLNELADESERTKLRDRLMREAQSAGVLSHPNIVTIFDVGREGDLAYIAMEYVNGPTLDRMVRAEPPTGRLVLSILTETAAALDYAHGRGVIHRDIKPANIMIHDGRMAKITDFGVAKIQSHQMTQAGSMIGTPNYMSPEQIQGHPVDGRSDQFSLAVIAYELLTGEKPFVADSIPSLAFKIVKGEPEAAHRLNPTLDWPVDTVLKRGLAKDAKDRYVTCTDFVLALTNACRACREWTPITAGAVHEAATVVEAPPPLRAVDPPRLLAEEESPSSALRWARRLAIVVFIVGAAFAVRLAFFDGLGRTPEQPVAQNPIAEAPAPAEAPGIDKRPSPAPPPAVPEPAPEEAEIPPDLRRAPERSTAVPTPVRLVTNPPGAFLVVDGSSSLSCQSPCTLTLPFGRHSLAASMEGYGRTLRIFEVPLDTEIFLHLERTTGTVMVGSEPRGANIIVDGQSRPERTPAVLKLPTGRHSIEVVHDGRRMTREVVVSNSISNVFFPFTDR